MSSLISYRAMEPKRYLQLLYVSCVKSHDEYNLRIYKSKILEAENCDPKKFTVCNKTGMIVRKDNG